jgi:RNA-binding protein 26
VIDPNALTLVVEKLPPEKTNIGDLSTYFGKFGTVTNVGVDPHGNRALVSFSSHQEAHAAWKSEEAVFGNRFVVIFWHRPAPGGGAAGQKALEASVGTLQKLNSNGNGESDDVDMAVGDAQNRPSKPLANGHASSNSTVMDSVMEAAAPKKAEPRTPQEVFEYATRVWLEKMKSAMDVMQSTSTTEAEKQEAKTKFKVLKSQKPQPPASNISSSKANGTSINAKDKLDIDLDMLASGQGQSLTQEEAQQALARLQELAAERGLDPDGLDSEGLASVHASGGYRGASRARGRRGGYRGRGRGRGGAMANASLDNRTKELLLQGYEKSGISDDVALDMVQSFYLVSSSLQNHALTD